MKLRKIISLAITVAIVMTNAFVISIPTASAATVDNTFTEDFEGYQLSTNVNTVLTALMHDGWYMVGENQVYTDTSAAPYKRLQNFVQVVNEDGRKCLMIGTPNQSTAYNTVGLGRALPGVALDGAATGIWEINFMFKPYATGNAPVQFLFSMNTADGSAANTTISQHNLVAAYKNKLYMGYRDYNALFNNGNSVPQGTLSGTGIGLRWYNVKAIVNCDARYYSVEIYDGNNLVARRSPISFNGNETIGFLKLSALGFDTGHRVYVDDISIAPASRETKIYEDDFESYTNVVLADSGMSVGGSAEDVGGSSYFEGYTPWRALTAAGRDYGLGMDFDLISNVVRLGDDPETSDVTEKSGLVYMPVKDKLLTPDTQMNRGKVKLSFKIKPDTIADSGYQVYSVPEYNGTSSTPFALANNNGTPALVTDNGDVDLDSSKWYAVETIMDAVNKGVKTTVSEVDGAQIAEFSRGFASLTAVKGVMFNAIGGTSVHMDDINIEYYEPDPVYDASAIVLKDSFGEIIEGTTDVTNAVKSIKIPFGCDMALTSAITLEDSNGDTVDFNVSRTGNSYELILGSALKANETYTVTVPSTVENIYGVALGGADRTFTFTTSEDHSDLMAIRSVKIGGADVSALSEITAESTINVVTKYANGTEEEVSGVAILAFYGNGKLIYADTDEITAQAGTYGTATSAFTIPEGFDMSGVDSVSVMLWDGFANITPYCEFVGFSRQ